MVFNQWTLIEATLCYVLFMWLDIRHMKHKAPAVTGMSLHTEWLIRDFILD